MKPRKTLQTMRTIDRIFLYMGFELSSNEWRMAFSTGLGERIVMRRCKAGDMGELAEVILAVKEEFGIGELAGIRSVYEAGFDAFWLHNTLTELGVANVIVDAASIEVNQRGRRRKTDRLDARQLVRKLIQYDLGDLEVWSVCHVPSRLFRGMAVILRILRVFSLRAAPSSTPKPTTTRMRPPVTMSGTKSRSARGM